MVRKSYRSKKKVKKKKKEQPYSIVYRNGVIYELQVLDLRFYDSLLLLPRSLAKLQKAFLPDNLLEKESYNPELFQMNNKIDALKLASLRIHVEDYMKTDVLLLYEILFEAQEYFHRLFPFLDITRRLTISSVSMFVFRAKYMPEKSIFKLSSNQDSFIRNAYFGGAVDV